MHSLILVVALVAISLAQEYALQASHSGATFFDGFDFYDAYDPSQGYVHYVDQATAKRFNMIQSTDETASWGVETTEVLDPYANLGRKSIRLVGLQQYTHGLFILDLAHMPRNQCGVWPAWWTLGGTGVWPTSGEIDIIEFTNYVPSDLMSAHTTAGCSIAGSDMTGTLLTNDCSGGCSINSTLPNSAGRDFNAIGGGVYAMEWTSAHIKMWFFPRDTIPTSLTQGQPNPSTFGVPSASFQGSCDIDAHFWNHSIIFDTDFCGQFAGPFFEADNCPTTAGANSWQSCNDYVALNPEAFTHVYWEVNSLQIYTAVNGAILESASSLSSATPVASTGALSLTSVSNALGASTTFTGSVSTMTTATLSAVAVSPIVPTIGLVSISTSTNITLASVVPPPVSSTDGSLSSLSPSSLSILTAASFDSGSSSSSSTSLVASSINSSTVLLSGTSTSLIPPSPPSNTASLITLSSSITTSTATTTASTATPTAAYYFDNIGASSTMVSSTDTFSSTISSSSLPSASMIARDVSHTGCVESSARTRASTSKGPPNPFGTNPLAHLPGSAAVDNPGTGVVAILFIAALVMLVGT